MAMQNFVLDLIEALLADKELGLTEDDIRFYDKNVTIPDQEDMDSHIRWQNARHFNVDSNVVRSSILMVQIKAPSGSGSEHISFHMGELYRNYRTDGLSTPLKKIKHVIQDAQGSAAQTMSILNTFLDYSAIKDKLILRPLNYDNNEKVLADAIYRRIGDIALVLYVSLGTIGTKTRNILSSMVKQDLFDHWDVEKEETLTWALENTMRLQPPVFCVTLSFSGKIENMPAKDVHFMEEKDCKFDFNGIVPPVLTTEQKVNGAISIFYPGVLKRLYELAGGDFYVAFTSIHDICIHPVKTCRVKPNAIRRSIWDTNRAMNQREEVLTREVYLYDGEEDTLRVVEV